MHTSKEQAGLAPNTLGCCISQSEDEKLTIDKPKIIETQKKAF
jgi:hypothetical protein